MDDTYVLWYRIRVYGVVTDKKGSREGQVLGSNLIKKSHEYLFPTQKNATW